MRTRSLRRDRTIVDDSATARLLRLHYPDRLLSAQEGAGKVRVQDPHPLLVSQIFDRDGLGELCLVDEKRVEPSKPVPCGGEKMLDRYRVPHVRGDGQHRLS